MTFYCFPVLSKKSRIWTILARHEDTLDEHLWFGMDFIRMSQSAALEWIEMLRGSNIDRAPLIVNVWLAFCLTIAYFADLCDLFLPDKSFLEPSLLLI